MQFCIAKSITIIKRKRTTRMDCKEEAVESTV